MEQEQKCVTNKECAEFYASRGLAVHPINYIKDGKCSCGKEGCKAPGKHPKTANGVKDATTDLAVIQKWWSEYPQANIGIATGAKSGIIVIDIDPRHSGNESFERLQKEFGKLPEPQVTTGGNGYHLYYRCPKHFEFLKNTVDLGGFKGIDVRGENGYVLAPPSNHVSGGYYRWNIIMELIPDYMESLPEWLINLAATPRTKIISDGQTMSSTRSAQGWVADTLKDLKEGNRNDSFARLTGKLMSGINDSDEIVTLLEPHAVKAGFDLGELAYEVAGICNRYTRRTSTSQPYYIQNVDIEMSSPIHITEHAEPKPQEFILDGILPEKHTTTLYGAGGNCKTYIGMAISLYVALGIDFVGIKTKQCKVLYLDWEMIEADHLRRAYQLCRGIGLPRPPANLYYWSLQHPLTSIIERITAFISEKEIGLVIVDSMGLASGGDAESAKAVIPLFAALKSMGVTILTLDHQSKMQDKQEYGNKTVFGSVYKYNLARSVLQIKKVGTRDLDTYVLISPKKNNFRNVDTLIPLKLGFEGNNIVRVTKAEMTDEYLQHITGAQSVIETLESNGGMTAKEIASTTGMNRGTVTNILSALKKSGRISEDGKKGNAPICVLKTPKQQVQPAESSSLMEAPELDDIDLQIKEILES